MNRDRHHPPRGHARCRAFSLVEMVVSLSIMGTLLVGIGSSVMIAAKALPGSNRPAAAVLDASRGADMIAGELAEALLVTEATATAVTFTVPDRNNDSNPETIRYFWGGAAGNPLTRSYNGAAPVNILDSVNSFALTYTTHNVTTTTTANVTAVSAEAQLATFTGWLLVLIPTSANWTSNTTSWAAETFSITPPAYCTKVNFTHCKMKLRTSVASGDFSLSVYKNSGGATPQPTAPIIGTATLPVTSLTAVYAWTDVFFSGVTDASPTTDYSVVVKGTVANAVQVQYYSNGGTNSNGVMMCTTANSGASWTNQGNPRDILFYIYGTFETVTPTTVNVTVKHLDRAAVLIRTGSVASTQVVTEVEALNSPVTP